MCLRRCATERLEAARVHVGIDGTRVHAELDTARRRGFLDEDTWRDLTVMLDKAAVSERVDLGAVAREISAVADRCAQGRALGLVEFNEEYEIKRHIPGVAERLDEIDRLIALDDLATSAGPHRSGRSWGCAANRRGDVSVASRVLPSRSQRPRWWSQPGASLDSDCGWHDGRCGLPGSFGRRAHRRRARPAGVVRRCEQGAGLFLGGHTPALRILGIDAESSRNAPLPSAADRRWVDLVGVRRTGKALVPAFGSATRDELRLLLCWNSPEVTTLLGWIAQDASEKPVAVLYFATLSPERRITLATALRERRERPVVVIDDAAILYLAAYGASSFDSAMRLVLPFSAVNPYEPFAAGDVPLEMFYGRSVERSSIMDQRGTSLIYGGRQLGKSALLRSAAGRFEQTNGYKALYVTLQRAPSPLLNVQKLCGMSSKRLWTTPISRLSAFPRRIPRR